MSRKWKTRSGSGVEWLQNALSGEGKLLSLHKLIHYFPLIYLISFILTVWDTVLILWVYTLFTVYLVFFSALFFRQRVSDHRQREASHSRPASDSTEVSGPPSPHLFSDDPHDRPFRGECFQELLTVGDWQLCGLWTLRNYVIVTCFFPSTFNLSFMSTEICLYWIDCRFLRSGCSCFCLHVQCILSVNLTKEKMAKFDLWKECLLLNSSILLLLDKGGWEKITGGNNHFFQRHTVVCHMFSSKPNMELNVEASNNTVNTGL